MTLQSAESLTGWIVPRSQGDGQSLDLRTPPGCERSKEFSIQGIHTLIPDWHADNVLHITTTSEEGIGGRGYDQSLNLGKFDTLERPLE